MDLKELLVSKLILAENFWLSAEHRELASMLVLDMNLWLAVEVDDEAEDHSLTELEGDMLELILDDIKEEGRPDLPDDFFLNGTFDEDLGIEDEALVTGLTSVFVLNEVDAILWTFLVKVLLPPLLLEEEDLPTSILEAPEVTELDASRNDAGLGTLLRGPVNTAALGTCIPLTPAATFIRFVSATDNQSNKIQ